MPASTLVNSSPPSNVAELAGWFAEGVRAEIAALEKDVRAQSYELLSGKPLEIRGSTQAVYQFLIADGTRIPEDASGKLRTQSKEYNATVIAQQENVVQLVIEGNDIPKDSIHRAILTVDDTALLRRLAEVLESVATDDKPITALSSLIFHPNRARVGTAKLADVPPLINITGNVRNVLERACGSEVTYVWGPPGTGKTYSIAHLILALIETGNRVLVTSHTHAAVNQILYEAIKSDDAVGPLATHSAFLNGEIVRVGKTIDPKIPDEVRLDKIVEARAVEVSERIKDLEEKILPLVEARARACLIIAEWDKLKELGQRRELLNHSLTEVEANLNTIDARINVAESVVSECKDAWNRAPKAWFRRQAKIAQAAAKLQEAELNLQHANNDKSTAERHVGETHRLLEELHLTITNQDHYCNKQPARALIEAEFSQIANTVGPFEQEIRELQETLAKIEQNVIDGSQVVFCTLTKLYTGKELEDQLFDAVIIDEISMALPPLAFLCAGRAESRAILVGDFLQLPPIVRSDTPVSNARLATDIFHLSGVVQDMKPSTACSVLVSLTVQQRMVPKIAEVARHIAYNRSGLKLIDHKKFQGYSPIEFEFLPKEPLIVVDTTDLRCWSGKQPGSLSRFNFYSALVSVEMAAMLAASIKRPTQGEPKPIGVVTPYAAQRRLLAKLVNTLDLGDWVVAGTVHTFQGNEAKIIIFDSVLDEPYWSARLCSPKDSNSVRRDLNVAVTRAKDKFIFVGSSAWLNAHAKLNSGLGELWAYLRSNSDFVRAIDVIGTDAMQNLTQRSLFSLGWSIPNATEGPVLERHDDVSFWGRFASDLNAARKSIFALAAFFGQYRWPRVQPLVASALDRGVEVTIVIPPVSMAPNPSYVHSVVKNLRELGAVVITASGIHGKDVIIDERIKYTGSLNWSSHRGTDEWIDRMEDPTYVKFCLELMQAKYIRQAAIHEDGTARLCPHCNHPTQIVNQRIQHGPWDQHQAMKVGCANAACSNYLRNLDERPPFRTPPLCSDDGRTKMRRVRRGRGEIWQCPKHPRQCPTPKIVPGDPA